ncbi:hypothetical protein DQQ10_23865 [Pseudochryseolinea flava]|uniref:DUF4412 domain-containing protein n=2 Tax=Pseudochryseolinea flava TaxID=2059302 RepID=A0A364XX76_9BACT|nr:hypothetical protein DQQ10_23865 [Pseudochryseolinea flava]
MLYLKDKDKVYSINHDAKTFSVLPNGEKGAVEKDAKVTKTTETKKILNYNCSKYVIESEINGKKFSHIVWATNEIKNIDYKSFSKHRYQGSKVFSFEKIDGVPLLMEINSKEGKMTMEAVQLKEQTLPAEEFVVPAAYKEVPPAFGF